MGFTTGDLPAVDPETFVTIDEAMRDPKIIAGATGIYLETRPLGLLLVYWMMLAFTWITKFDTGVVFCRREDFDAVGGYDERLTAAEDWDLSQRVAQIGALGRINAYITHLEGRLTLQQTMRSKFYYGQTLGRYVRKQPGKAVRQLQLVRPAFVRHWRGLLAHPVLTAGMVVMKTCEFAAGAGLVLASYRRSRTSSPA